MKCAALDFGMDERLLDHIAPFASMMKIPLFITEEKNRDFLDRYYPMVERRFFFPKKISPTTFASYDLLFQSTFWRPLEKAFFSLGRKKKLFFAYLPHGNSDKGYLSPMMDLISLQDFILVYGEHMIERLKKQNLWNGIKNWAYVGNYRYAFYHKHKNFYDEIVEKEIFSSLSPRKRILLYAPTWKDPENSSSFFSHMRRLVAEVPLEYQLIIKPHPLLEEEEPALYHATIGMCEGKENITLLERFPLIYPLLERIDIYLGDFSSIGYDFLPFQRPMFFFATEEKIKEETLFLRCCGLEIPPEEKIFSFIENNLHNDAKEKQKEMARFSFEEEKTLVHYRKGICSQLQKLVESFS